MRLVPPHIIGLFLIFLFSSLLPTRAQDKISSWPEISNTTKPWTRWWWMGNAVDKQGIRQNLVAFQKSGLGGVEITPIYGVKGEEDNYLKYLSPQWMEMLNYTIKIADSLGMQVDMTLGTGWPYGGPQVTQEYAATQLIVDRQKVVKGTKIEQRIRVKEENNRENAVLNYVLAFGEDGSYLDLTNQLKGDLLSWMAKKTDYMLYSVFTGKTGQHVKRAAPGGEGYTLDHYSKDALTAYVKPFDAAFEALHGKPRAIFNDSYEVYGTDFTPGFFKTFQEKRGYDLKPHLDLLVSTTDNEEGNRVKSDYRETLSDLLLTQFDEPWTQWAHTQDFKTRLQAHGSPGNLIDLYASADIPECETFGSMPFDIPGLRREKEDIRKGDADPIMLKFSSSAAHISGKPLTSSETFTWLREHFKTALSQTKPEAEELLLNGINHIFLHGSTYSPKRAAWPGWKFYASVNFSPNNTIWEDAPALFSYIANCQSMLQAGQADNETLLYWPIYDVWDDYLNGTLFFQFKIHSLDEWLHGTHFYTTAKKLLNKGYGVDFISDSFIEAAKVVEGNIVLPGGSYKSLVIPDCEKMPLKTLEKLLALQKGGAHIIFEGLPKSVPGFYRYKEQNLALAKMIKAHKNETKIGDALTILEASQMYPEDLLKMGLKFIRRDIEGEKIYYLVNHTANPVNTFVPLQVKTDMVILYDPLTKIYGKASIEKEATFTKVKVNIPSGKSIFLKTGKAANMPLWNYYEVAGDAIEIHGDWKLEFVRGGPKLPKSVSLSTLKSWTTLGQDAENFSGTVRYEIEFAGPDVNADNWRLNLGDVRESAKVWLNGTYLGDAWSVPFILDTGKLQNTNKLVIQVTNLAANRIRAKELRNEEWKIFHEINIVDKDYKEFDAAEWNSMPSGLLGPIQLTPLKLEK